MGRDRAETVRGDGRGRLEAGVTELLDEATLDDLLRFISVRRLVDHTGLSNGAIYKVSSGPAALARSTTISKAVSIGEPTIRMFERYAELVEGLQAGDEQSRIQFSEYGAENVLGWALGSGRVEFTAALLASAVAHNDPEAAQALRHYYDESVEAFGAVLAELIEAWQREPLEDFTTDHLAILAVSFGDGLAMRARFDPRVTPELIARGLQSLTAGTTRRIGIVDDDLQFRLGFNDDRSTSAADQETLTIVAEQVKALYRQRGWSSVTITAVSDTISLTRGRIRSLFGDQDGLSLAVWNQFIPGLDRIIEQHATAVPVALVERYLVGVVERAQEHPEVTESLRRTFRRHDLLLAAELEAGAKRSRPRRAAVDDTDDDNEDDDIDDAGPSIGRGLNPRLAVPITGRLYDALLAHQPEALVADARWRRGLLEYTTHLCDSCLSRAVIMPRAEPEDVVGFAMHPDRAVSW